MKLTIERTALLKALGHVQSVVERRNTIPILSNVKIEAGDGRLGLNATDMDLEITDTVAADVSAPAEMEGKRESSEEKPSLAGGALMLGFFLFLFLLLIVLSLL